MLLINAGMVQLPVYILHKRTNLTDQEFNQIKTIPCWGIRLEEIRRPCEKVALVSLHHHEQYDGKGYPHGYQGIRYQRIRTDTSIADNICGAHRKKELP